MISLLSDLLRNGQMFFHSFASVFLTVSAVLNPASPFHSVAFSPHIRTCPDTAGHLWQVWCLSHAGHRRWMWEKEVTSTPRAPLTPLSPIPHGPNHTVGSPQGNAREFPLWAHAEVRNRNNAHTSGNYPLLYIFTSSSVFPHCLFLRAILGAIVFTVLYLKLSPWDR